MLLLRDIFEILRDLRGVYAAEAVALTAGEYGRGHLLQLRRCEDEHKMLRRLLQYFEERIERRGGEHMHLVDDVHALFHGGGRKHRFLAQGAHIVNAVIRCGVKLHHVHHGALAYAAAGGAHAAGIAVYRVLAVDGPGKYSRAGGLAGAAGTDKEIGM